MNNSTLQELKTNTQRDKVWSPRGEENIKSDKDYPKYKWINYKGQRFPLDSIRVDNPLSAHLDYIFSYKFQTEPDEEMETLIDQLIYPSKYGIKPTIFT